MALGTHTRLLSLRQNPLLVYKCDVGRYCPSNCLVAIDLTTSLRLTSAGRPVGAEEELLSKHRLGSVLLVAGLTTALASCGGSADEPEGSTPSAVDTASTEYQQAQQRVEEFTAGDLEMPISDLVALPDRPLSIAYTQCVQTVCTEISDAVQEAADAIGATYTPLFHQDTPDTVQAAFQTAVQMKADIVLTSGDPVEWFQPQLDQLEEQGAVVVGWSLPGGYKLDGIAANLISGDDYYFHGVLMADYAITKTDGLANVLFLNVPTYPVLATLGEGVTTETEATCPDCTVTEVDLTVDDVVAGNATNAAIAAIQRDPDINFIIGAFGGLITQQLVQGLTGAGYGDIPAISAAGTASNYELIRTGQTQVADLAIPTGLLAWRAVDAGLRALAGQDVGTYERPESADVEGHADVLAGGVTQMFVEEDSVPAEGDGFDPVPDYQSAFKQLWGVN